MRFLIVLLLLLLCLPACLPMSNQMETLLADVAAVQALIEQFDDTEIITRMEPWYDTLPAFVVHAEAAASFGECAVDPLIVALRDENPQVRTAAAIALEAVGPAAIKAKPLLEEMLQSDIDHTNILACAIIRGIGPGAADLVDLVRARLHDENFHVQYWACRALGGIGLDAAHVVNDLLDCLTTGVASVRRNAALALGEITKTIDNNGPIIQALEQVKKNDRSVPVRDAARDALSVIKECPVE
jgi:HEAT repeat protein